ncbi:cupin domain-containing protein [Micromonospora arborensis]|uniref:cupin domain-containing protein n=1 Tax=Micromonospora arborensis TaxID=2116518 RepID=UPI00371FCDAC
MGGSAGLAEPVQPPAGAGPAGCAGQQQLRHSQLGVAEVSGAIPAQRGAHFQRTFSESFYVVSGTVRLYGGSGWIDGRPGYFLHVPEGGVHGFRNDSDAEAVMLILFAPGIPCEAYFRELAEIAATGRTLSEEEWTDLFARHDQCRA